MIYTLTLNTAIDMNIRCLPLQAAAVNRTKSTYYSPNGKGVNVARVLQHFQRSAKVLGFFGGFTGHYIVDELTSAGCQVLPTWVEEPTRINVFINDSQQEYKVVSAGSYIPESAQRELIEHINKLTDADYLVVSGSLPPGVEHQFYHQIMTLCQKKNIAVILDISHPCLEQLLEYHPLLIKPNDEEVREIFGFDVKSHEQAVVAIKYIHHRGARNILLSMGDKGLYFSNGQHLYFCNALQIELISSACSGDAALAAFLSVWLINGDVKAAMALACATGADVAGSDGLGQLDRVTRYLSQINVEQISKVDL